MFDLGALFWTEIGPPAKMGFKNFLEVARFILTECGPVASCGGTGAEPLAWGLNNDVFIKSAEVVSWGWGWGQLVDQCSPFN